MMEAVSRASALWVVALLLAGATPAAAPPSSREVLDRYLATMNGAERGQVAPVADGALARSFPGDDFYALRFSQYPVAIAPPPPLASNNIFVVKSDGSVRHLRDLGALKELFQTALTPVRTQTEARDATEAWLRLSQEFAQDGFLRFVSPHAAVQVASGQDGGLLATGRAVVDPRGGNRGQIVASLTFDAAGRMTDVWEKADIKRGIRPICQATKLLDPDPTVRGMAEQDILVMGRAAKRYLDEVRSTASPLLRQAIDRIWDRILAEDR
jgi:hypothetical protein